ncbi:carboxypeptidase regulatory-like domain-containing protein [Patescibacteria group bacterium]|nr:MAG: carboxypeptidase regulatory-like domain-containing protein [Patescibacteria group bacterium]
MPRRKILFAAISLSVMATVFLVLPTFASSTDGAIDLYNRYAWSSKIGWISFRSDNGNTGNIHITDTALTGYAWSDHYGWINLSPSTSGVKNNGEGSLSGYAWGQNLGWINFSGVTINSRGEFLGQASGDNAGIINFVCANCSVKTDWRPASARGGVPPSSQPPSGGGGGASTPVIPPSVPPLIGEGESIPPPQTPPSVPPLIGEGAAITPPQPSALARGLGIVKSLLAKLIPKKIVIPKIPIAKFFAHIKDFFKPPQVTIPLRELVAKKTPLSMRSGWEYIDPRQIKKFVFAPLPKEFTALAQKFPEVKNLFGKVGVSRMSDLQKIGDTKLALPGLSKSLGLAPLSAKGQSVPVSYLPKNLKDKIPSDIVFARGLGEMVDYSSFLTLTDKGRAEQKIITISGKILQLSIRPDKKVKSIRGYVIFRSKKPSASAYSLPLADLLNSITFAMPALAREQVQPVSVEEKLVLAEFEYTDPDGDGVYTAEVKSPIPAGEYEIINVIDYDDPELGKKEIRLITVVDPEGYVYEKIGDKELRIPGAVISLYWLNPDTRQYELWPAEDFQQENNQVTDARGSYSFLVPTGMYSIKVIAPGYIVYESRPFEVAEGGGVHFNIELLAKNWWLKLFDWRTIGLILVALLLLFNFYKDRKRARWEGSGLKK